MVSANASRPRLLCALAFSVSTWQYSMKGETTTMSHSKYTSHNFTVFNMQLFDRRLAEKPLVVRLSTGA